MEKEEKEKKEVKDEKNNSLEQDVIAQLRVDPNDDCSGCCIGWGKSYVPGDPFGTQDDHRK